MPILAELSDDQFIQLMRDNHGYTKQVAEILGCFHKDVQERISDLIENDILSVAELGSFDIITTINRELKKHGLYIDTIIDDPAGVVFRIVKRDVIFATLVSKCKHHKGYQRCNHKRNEHLYYKASVDALICNEGDCPLLKE